MLSLNDLSFSYARRKVLESVSLHLAAGQSAAITGKTGSGKSTLLGCICGLVKPKSGDVAILGRSVPAMSKRALAQYRREHIGVVFQFGELLPALTSVENVALPAMLNGVSWSDAQAGAVALLEAQGVAVTDAPAMSLSGGERTRVAIARALINDPELVIADEPTGALDTETRDVVADLLYAIPRQSGSALLVVTHDPAVAHRANEVYELRDTRLALSTDAAAA